VRLARHESVWVTGDQLNTFALQPETSHFLCAAE
jgi:hypothetical protein